MNKTVLVAAALFTLSGPAFADQKGDALIQNWIARIPELQPITAETTTTYTFGKWVAIHKFRGTISGQNHASTAHTISRYDDEFPHELVNDPLGDNFNPLPYGPQDLSVFPNGTVDHTKYIGKETVDGTEFDVVQVQEYLVQHITPPSRVLEDLKRKKDNTISIKWYLDSEGIVRRMTFAADVQIADLQIPSNAPPRPVLASPAPRSSGTEKFTATMVVVSLRKSRQFPARAALSDPLFTIPVKGGNVQAFAFSPDGKMLAIGGGDKPQIISTESGLPRYSLADAGNALLVDFSGDGKFVAFSNPHGLKVLRTADGQMVRDIVMPKRSFESIRMSADGRFVVITDSSPNIEVWNVATGMQERTLKDGRKDNGMVYEAIFSSDGKRLVTAGYNSDVLVWDTQTWKVILRLPVRSAWFLPIAVSPDGKHIAMATEDRGALLWDGSDVKPIKELKGAAGSIWFLSFSNDGKTLYAGDRDERDDIYSYTPGLTSWNVESGSVTGDYAAWKGANPAVSGHAVISPDGRLGAFRERSAFSGTIRVNALPERK